MLSFYIHVGPEIGVASTKAFTGQVTVLTLLALALGHEQGTLNNADYYQMIEELSEIPQKAIMLHCLKVTCCIIYMSRKC